MVVLGRECYDRKNIVNEKKDFSVTEVTRRSRFGDFASTA